MQPPQRITEDFAIENIGSLVSKRIKAGLSIKELSLLTGVSKLSLYRYENGTLPSGKNYNKIAKYFGWELVDNAKDVNSGRKKTVREHITEKEFHNTLLEIRRKEEEMRLLLEVRKKALNAVFDVGKCYYIGENEHSKKNYHTHSKKYDNENFVFKYEGKQGIHHCFREIHGDWTRTYTDVQLIGKHIKEVTDE